MTEGKRWWLSPIADAIYNYQLGIEGKIGEEVQIAPLDAVVLERGTRWWAAYQAEHGKRVSRADSRLVWEAGEILWDREDAEYDTGWVELPAPWAPSNGDRVRWTRCDDYGTGTYKRAVKPPETMRAGHWVSVGDIDEWFVETVSPLEARDGK